MTVVYANESEFQAAVIEYAQDRGWLVHASDDANTGKRYRKQRGDAGFPDLCMLRDGVVILAELKMPGGSLSADQRRWWMESVGLAIGGRASHWVWRPTDWVMIEQVLE